MIERLGESRFAGWCVIAALLAILLAVLVDVRATPAQCDPSIPNPPLLIVLPDGTEIPAASLSYDLGSRMVTVQPWDGLFCNGFEAPG